VWPELACYFTLLYGKGNMFRLEDNIKIDLNLLNIYSNGILPAFAAAFKFQQVPASERCGTAVSTE
jgi:hypothetical protein